MPGSRRPRTVGTRSLADGGGGILVLSVLAGLPAGYAVPYCQIIATYCWDHIFCTSLAPIGGSADERTIAPSPEGLVAGSRAASAGKVAIAETAEGAVLPDAEPATENNGSAASDAGSGMEPRGVDEGPVGRDQPISG